MELSQLIEKLTALAAEGGGDTPVTIGGVYGPRIESIELTEGMVVIHEEE
jgi:hypothetical protein